MKRTSLFGLLCLIAVLFLASCSEKIENLEIDETKQEEASAELKATENWVMQSQTNFPQMSIPSWHWMRAAERRIDLNVSTHFSGSTLSSGWSRSKLDWDGSRGTFPFKFALWESDANWASQVSGGFLNLRIYWDNNVNMFLGGYVHSAQKYVDGLFQIKSYIDKSEKGWVHGFWINDQGHEIDIYEIKGIGYSGNDERTQMPTNIHRFIWSQNSQGKWVKEDKLGSNGMPKTFYNLPSAGNGSTYACLKSANYIEFFNNGTHLRRIDKGNNQYLGQVFAHASYIILNSEYQDWIGQPSNKTAVWNHKIDYFVRYKW